MRSREASSGEVVLRPGPRVEYVEVEEWHGDRAERAAWRAAQRAARDREIRDHVRASWRQCEQQRCDEIFRGRSRPAQGITPADVVVTVLTLASGFSLVVGGYHGWPWLWAPAVIGGVFGIVYGIVYGIAKDAGGSDER